MPDPANDDSKSELSKDAGSSENAEEKTFRARSVYTTTKGMAEREDTKLIKRCSEFEKYLERMESEQYEFHPSTDYRNKNFLMDQNKNDGYSSSMHEYGMTESSSNERIRIKQEDSMRKIRAPIIKSQHKNTGFYNPAMDTSWRVIPRDIDLNEFRPGPSVSSHGVIVVRLREKIRVDITVDRAIRLTNPKNNICIALNSNGSCSGVMHPNGRVWQYGSRVEITTSHGFTAQQKKNKQPNAPETSTRYAKMWYKGVSFTAEQCALVYLVDSAGTRTTTDSFSDLSKDISLNVFLADARHGPGAFQDCCSILQTAQNYVNEDGFENWVINGIRITQTPDGLVRVSRKGPKYQIRTSPSNGTVSLTTPFIHCTASLGHTPHLFVKRGERRMHFDGMSFIVRNAGHSAGFDEKNHFKVY